MLVVVIAAWVLLVFFVLLRNDTLKRNAKDDKETVALRRANICTTVEATAYEKALFRD
jgi:hypothetical protein